MLAYVYDFLSVFFDKLKDREKIRSITLFGSVARGEQKKDSDVDLFIDINDNKLIGEIQSFCREAVNEFELRSEKTWKLRGITLPLSVLVGDLQSEQWNELRRELTAYGILIYGKCSFEKREGDNVLISYDLSSLKQHQKMAVLRELYGYTLKKGKKVYRREGIVSSLNIDKLSNVLFVNVKDASAIREALQKHRVKFREL
ncbi:MAG: nucleotidyltransferase domain-containing protein [Nanoarchaeota archaeon]